jgi:hypothetical protein
VVEGPLAEPTEAMSCAADAVLSKESLYRSGRHDHGPRGSSAAEMWRAMCAAILVEEGA